MVAAKRSSGLTLAATCRLSAICWWEFRGCLNPLRPKKIQCFCLGFDFLKTMFGWFLFWFLKIPCFMFGKPKGPQFHSTVFCPVRCPFRTGFEGLLSHNLRTRKTHHCRHRWKRTRTCSASLPGMRRQTALELACMNPKLTNAKAERCEKELGRVLDKAIYSTEQLRCVVSAEKTGWMA